jgi:hypothetical protein
MADFLRSLEEPGTGSGALLYLDQSVQGLDTYRRATGTREEKLMGDTWAIIQGVLLSPWDRDFPLVAQNSDPRNCRPLGLQGPTW